jgi:hypothetical protein
MGNPTKLKYKACLACTTCVEENGEWNRIHIINAVNNIEKRDNCKLYSGEHIEFSNSACEICNRDLPGERYDITGIINTGISHGWLWENKSC